MNDVIIYSYKYFYHEKEILLQGKNKSLEEIQSFSLFTLLTIFYI